MLMIVSTFNFVFYFFGKIFSVFRSLFLQFFETCQSFSKAPRWIDYFHVPSAETSMSHYRHTMITRKPNTARSPDINVQSPVAEKSFSLLSIYICMNLQLILAVRSQLNFRTEILILVVPVEASKFHRYKRMRQVRKQTARDH